MEFYETARNTTRDADLATLEARRDRTSDPSARRHLTEVLDQAHGKSKDGTLETARQEIIGQIRQGKGLEVDRLSGEAQKRQ